MKRELAAVAVALVLITIAGLAVVVVIRLDPLRLFVHP